MGNEQDNIPFWYLILKDIITLSVPFFGLFFTFFSLLLTICALIMFWKRLKSTDELIEIKNRVSYETAFLEAIKLFESENDDVIMGALDSLQRMLKECPQYADQVLQVCFRFIRNNSNSEKENSNPSFIREDTNRILEIFRKNSIVPKKRYFNIHAYSLKGSHLSYANFTDMTLQCINFKSINFENADLRRSDFEMCDFSGSNLCRAHFAGTKLFGAHFMDCDLSFVKFYRNDLTRTIFCRSILIGTEFDDIKEKEFPGFKIKRNKNFGFFEDCMIVYKGKLLANHEKFHDNPYGNPSIFETTKEELFEAMVTNDHMDENDFNTKFPEYINVKIIDNGPFFELEWRPYTNRTQKD